MAILVHIDRQFLVSYSQLCGKKMCNLQLYMQASIHCASALLLICQQSFIDGCVPHRVKAAGVNRADCWQREGNYPPPAGASEVIGLECCGTVLEVRPCSPSGLCVNVKKRWEDLFLLKFFFLLRGRSFLSIPLLLIYTHP